MTYSEKLKDSRWQKKRLEVLKRDNNCCRICNSKNKLEVHHTIYLKDKEPWEYRNSLLLTLCSICHYETEVLINKIKWVLSFIQRDKPGHLDNARVVLERLLNDESFTEYKYFKND